MIVILLINYEFILIIQVECSRTNLTRIDSALIEQNNKNNITSNSHIFLADTQF